MRALLLLSCTLVACTELDFPGPVQWDRGRRLLGEWRLSASRGRSVPERVAITLDPTRPAEPGRWPCAVEIDGASFRGSLSYGPVPSYASLLLEGSSPDDAFGMHLLVDRREGPEPQASDELYLDIGGRIVREYGDAFLMNRHLPRYRRTR